MAKSRPIWREHPDAAGYAAAALSGGLLGTWIAGSTQGGLVDTPLIDMPLWMVACLAGPFLSGCFAQRQAVAVGLVSVAAVTGFVQAARASALLGPQFRHALEPGRADALLGRLGSFAAEGAVASAIGFALSLIVSLPMQKALNEQRARDEAKRIAAGGD